MAKAVAVKTTKEGKRFFAELAKLSGLEVKAGFTAGGGGHGAGHESVSADDYKDGPAVAQVAAWNEFGTKHVPARPFMRQAAAKIEEGLAKAAPDIVAALAKGEIDADGAMREIGAWQVGMIQNEIREGGFAENAPSTKRQKDSETPLYDTGRMAQSVHYAVT